MSRSSEKGIAHILLMVVLLAGLAFGVYLVTQRTNLFSRASSHPISQPIIPEGARRVFLTSTTYDGNLGGPVGADVKCQARADAADLGGTWKAWLSDSTTPASSRLEHSSRPYVLVNGRRVAENWSDLTDESLQDAIKVDEFGVTRDWVAVWTNTQADGSRSQQNSYAACDDWTSNRNSSGGVIGNSHWGNQYWTNAGSVSCDYPTSLYCFEQAAPVTPTPVSQGGPVIDLPGPLPDIPVPPIFNPVPDPEPAAPPATPAPEPTPTLAPGSNNWGTDTQIVCLNGSTPQKRERTRLVYTIWPDEPYDLNNPVKFRRGEFSYDDPEVQIISITNNLSVSSGYVGVETESGQFLVPTGRPQDDDLEYGKFFGINMVRWYKNELPRGYYNIPFEAPESWCR